ncbi:MAG: N-acetyltransferase family protein [Syntrophobacteria bacterium]
MKALDRYPCTVILDDGKEVILRPLAKTDKARLTDFFGAVPLEDRLYLRDNVTDRTLIARWVDNLDFDRVLPIVAVYREEIIGDIILERCCLEWKRHLGNVRILVSRKFQNKGLGRTLIREMNTVASELGLEKLTVEIPVNPSTLGAIKAFSYCGFQRVAMLDGLVKDQQGRYSSLLVMIHDLRPSFQERLRGIRESSDEEAG